MTFSAEREPSRIDELREAAEASRTHTQKSAKSVAVVDRRTPEELEASGVTFVARLDHALAAIGARRMLYARLNWDAFIPSAYPPGALPPQLARAVLTRQAKKEADAVARHVRDTRRRDFDRLREAALRYARRVSATATA